MSEVTHWVYHRILSAWSEWVASLHQEGALMVYIVNTFIVVAILILLTKVFSILRNDRGLSIADLEKDIPLERLADLWRQGKVSSGEISIEKLAPVWREVDPQEEMVALELRHERARRFWQQIARYYKRLPVHREVCAHVLTILDQDGDCPSVVNVQTFRNDTESSWDSNTYNLLGMTTLLDHSINVAEHIIELLIDIEAVHVIPDGVIAALAHDLGKTPSLQGQLYSTGDHPIAAGASLAAINRFQELPDKDREEISKAVKHHHKTLDNLLAQNLRRADQQARQREMDWATAELVRLQQWRQTQTPASPPSQPQATGETVQPAEGEGASILVAAVNTPEQSTEQVQAGSNALPKISAAHLRQGLASAGEAAENEIPATASSETSPPASAMVPLCPPAPFPLQPEAKPAEMAIPAAPGDPAKAWTAEQALFGDSGSQAEKTTASAPSAPRVIAISHWFDADEFMRRLKPYINKTAGRRFYVFSMPNGVVYFQVGILEKEIRRMAGEKNIAEVSMLAKQDTRMQDVLLSVVDELRRHDWIETSLIANRYYGGYFIIQYRSGQSKRGYYTPFRAEPFGMPSALEDLKHALGSLQTLDFVNVVPDIAKA